MIGDRLDIHSAVYQGPNGDRLIYIPSSDPRTAGSGICYLAPRTGSGVTWAGAAPPYLILQRPVFMVMAAAALQYPDGVLYPIEKMEDGPPFQYRRNGVEFEDLDHEHVRVYW